MLAGLCDVTPYIPLEIYRYLGETYLWKWRSGFSEILACTHLTTRRHILDDGDFNISIKTQ
jgi:hypothetical protein